MTRTSHAEGWQVEGNSADAYERYLASAFSPWASALVELAKVLDGERVLDVACGTGIVARHAAVRVGTTGKVVGLDVNEDMLRVAESACAHVRPAIEWRHGNAAALSLPSEAFDAVFCHQAMAFFSDPVAVLREMHRVLVPGGRLAASVCRPLEHCPAYAALASALERHVGSAAGAMMRSPFSTWDVDRFRTLFTDAGFLGVRVRIEVCSIRYPSCDELLRREASSSPLAGPIGALDAGVRRELLRDLQSALSDHVDDDGVVCPVETYVALGRRA